MLHCENRSVGITAQTQWRPNQIFVSATLETVILTACASRETSSIYQCVFVAHCSNQITLHRPKKLRHVSESVWGQYFLSPRSSSTRPLSHLLPRHTNMSLFHSGISPVLNSALGIFFPHTDQRPIVFYHIHHSLFVLTSASFNVSLDCTCPQPRRLMRISTCATHTTVLHLLLLFFLDCL